jgi:glycerol-3-phosphate acyltransferase PlsY
VSWTLPFYFYLAAVVLGYLLGSIPFGLVLTRLAGLGDIRQIGSGNIGATNVLRTGRKDLAAATLILDAGKGGIAALIALRWGFDLAILAGGAAFLGHLFPVWLGFKGGKGVATFIGTLLGVFWPIGLIVIATWLLVAGLLRISSLSALVAAATAPVWAWYLSGPALAALCLFMAVLIFIRHHENIRRLAAGTEPRIGKKKPAETA